MLKILFFSLMAMAQHFGQLDDGWDSQAKVNVSVLSEKPLVDPRMPTSELNLSTHQFAIPSDQMKVNSVEVYMRNTTVHFPTTLVFQDGKIHPLPLVGLMVKSDIEEKILRQLRELKE